MVPRLWPESTIVCIGSGPSLIAADVYLAKTAPVRTLAINTAYQWVPSPDVLVGADAKWWGWHPDAVALPSLKFSLQQTPYPQVIPLTWTTGDGIDLDPTRVRGGGHSGYAAINVAVHLGARTIVLLGYDLAPNAHGDDHCHAPHPDGSHLQYAHRREIYRTLLAPLADRGIRIVNASRETTVPEIPRLSLAEAVAG